MKLRALVTLLVLVGCAFMIGCQDENKQASSTEWIDSSWDESYYWDEEYYDSYAVMNDESLDYGWQEWDEGWEYSWYEEDPEYYWGEGEDLSYQQEYAFYQDLDSYYGEVQDYSYVDQEFFTEDEFAFYGEDEYGWYDNDFEWYDNEYSWYENEDFSGWQDEYSYDEMQGEDFKYDYDDEYSYYYDDEFIYSAEDEYLEAGYWASGWDED